MTQIDLRIARQDEIALMLDWAAREGWNPGRDDAAAFHAADPEGFFVAVENGEAVAAISVVNHSPDMAFLGLFICRPDRRGRGIGKALWDYALRHAASRTVGLDGVAAQEANYAASGFRRTGASRRLVGSLRASAQPGFRIATPEDAALLVGLDRRAVGHDRRRFIAAWTSPGPTRRTVLSAAGTGFATIRLCREGCKIGPVVAEDLDAALALVGSALGLFAADSVAIDVPSESRLAPALLKEGFRETFATARMYLGPPPRGDGTQHAIATMELG